MLAQEAEMSNTTLDTTKVVAGVSGILGSTPARSGYEHRVAAGARAALRTR